MIGLKIISGESAYQTENTMCCCGKIKTIVPRCIYVFGSSFAIYYLDYCLTFLSLSFPMLPWDCSLSFESGLTVLWLDLLWLIQSGRINYAASSGWALRGLVHLPFTPLWRIALSLPCEEAGLASWRVIGHMEDHAGASAAAPTTRYAEESLEPYRAASPLDTCNTGVNRGKRGGESLNNPPRSRWIVNCYL